MRAIGRFSVIVVEGWGKGIYVWEGRGRQREARGRSGGKEVWKEGVDGGKRGGRTEEEASMVRRQKGNQKKDEEGEKVKRKEGRKARITVK